MVVNHIEQIGVELHVGFTSDWRWDAEPEGHGADATTLAYVVVEPMQQVNLETGTRTTVSKVTSIVINVFGLGEEYSEVCVGARRLMHQIKDAHFGMRF